ncbi:hypothetical protein Micbo1qcDRAFT_180995 [Microdochium bolleyi]|uniref:Uncharacterized protein n=1 Tax=Microdochium bolleyi TaxID=196109 RepID=A0A136IJX2_9PEZI|nr:hypothetical protein Micbo1qcDRAFT_180995 [Microdochium bolleyi]
MSHPQKLVQNARSPRKAADTNQRGPPVMVPLLLSAGCVSASFQAWATCGSWRTGASRPRPTPGRRCKRQSTAERSVGRPELCHICGGVVNKQHAMVNRSYRFVDLPAWRRNGGAVMQAGFSVKAGKCRRADSLVLPDRGKYDLSELDGEAYGEMQSSSSTVSIGHSSMSKVFSRRRPISRSGTGGLRT